jgi:hypothetical protein
MMDTEVHSAPKTVTHRANLSEGLRCHDQFIAAASAVATATLTSKTSDHQIGDDDRLRSKNVRAHVATAARFHPT